MSRRDRAKKQTVVASVGGNSLIRDRNRESIPDRYLAACETDKDLESSLLVLGFNTPAQRWLDRVTAAETPRYLGESHFLAGSMGPNVQAIVERGVITNPENLSRAVAGGTGTLFKR